LNIIHTNLGRLTYTRENGQNIDVENLSNGKMMKYEKFCSHRINPKANRRFPAYSVYNALQ